MNDELRRQYLLAGLTPDELDDPIFMDALQWRMHQATLAAAEADREAALERIRVKMHYTASERAAELERLKRYAP